MNENENLYEKFLYGKKNEGHLKREEKSDIKNFSALKKMGFFENVKNMLVIGCPNLAFIEKSNDLGISVNGLDIDPDMIDGEIVLKCNVEKESFPFENEKFDLIYSKGFIQHLEKPPLNFIGEIKRTLKKNGKIVMIVRNEKSIKNIFDIWDNYKHKSSWTPISLQRLLEDFGFEVVHNEPRFNFNPLRKLLILLPFKWLIGGTIVIVAQKNN